LEKDSRRYLSNNLGIAFLCEPSKGSLKAYSQVIITVTAFNDICGLFEDNLNIEIKGMPVFRFPIEVDIKGTPIIVSPYQLGINYHYDYPLYHLGYYMKNNAPIKREFRITNTGPKDI